jgi:putative two-component system response regulator
MALASHLHDIGKLGIPIEILQKSAPLTDEELALIRTHCRRGHEIMHSTTDPLMALASEIALHHHERHDGSGYPDGLSGAMIPIECQIALVCDTYDALRQTRPYRLGMSHNDAMHVLTSGDGRTKPEHFAPNVMVAFKRVSDTARSIFESYTASAHLAHLMA